MISYKNLFEKLIDEDGIRRDIFEASKGKRDSYYVYNQVGDLTNDPDNPKLQSTIKRIKKMYMEGFDLIPRSQTIINDGVKLKKRNIRKPTFFPEQIMTHGLVRVMKEAMQTGMYEFVCGSVPNRGPHYGKKYIRKWITNDPKKCKVRCKIRYTQIFRISKASSIEKVVKTQY